MQAAPREHKQTRRTSSSIEDAWMLGLDSGPRPFHEDYRHYKYYGFGGMGAKTAWGFNPKYSE